MQCNVGRQKEIRLQWTSWYRVSGTEMCGDWALLPVRIYMHMPKFVLFFWNTIAGPVNNTDHMCQDIKVWQSTNVSEQ